MEGERAKIEGEPVRLPWRRIALVVVAAPGTVAVAWTFAAPNWGWDGFPLALRAFLAVAPVGLVGWLVTLPWRTRPVIDWTTAWLAGTVVRFLLTPAAAAALYFSAPFEARQFVAATGACYFASLMAEVAMIAMMLQGRGRRPGIETPADQEA